MTILKGFFDFLKDLLIEVQFSESILEAKYQLILPEKYFPI